MLCQRPYLLQKQHKNYILYSLLLLYLLIMISKDMERQSNRVSEQQRCAPGLHWTRSLCDPAPGPHWTRPLCTPAPCLNRTRPFCTPAPCLQRTRPFYTPAPCPLPDQAPLQELFCSRPSLLQNQQLYMLKKTLQTDNYHLSAYETQLQHPARTLTPSKFCYYLI